MVLTVFTSRNRTTASATIACRCFLSFVVCETIATFFTPGRSGIGAPAGTIVTGPSAYEATPFTSACFSSPRTITW